MKFSQFSKFKLESSSKSCRRKKSCNSNKVEKEYIPRKKNEVVRNLRRNRSDRHRIAY